MHDGMQYDPIQGSRSWALQSWKSCHFQKTISSTIYNGSWQL